MRHFHAVGLVEKCGYSYRNGYGMKQTSFHKIKLHEHNLYKKSREDQDKGNRQNIQKSEVFVL
jgi:hypothetical protein